MKTASFAPIALGLALGAVTPALAQQPQARPAAPAPATGAPDLRTPEQKTAYAIGMDLSHQLKPAVGEYDPTLMAMGLRDGLMGKAALTDAQFMEVMEGFRQKMMAKQREMMAQQQGGAATTGVGAKNLKDGQAFLAANKAKPGITTLPSGVQYKVLKAGTGKSPKATDVVKANYRGTLLDGTEFDASAKHGGPLEFPVNRVIPGWTEILQKMKVGDKYQVFIPGDMAYGPEGNAPDIGPNATLIFDIELVDVIAR